MTGRGIIIAKQGDMVQIEVKPGGNCAGCNACIVNNTKSVVIEARNDIAAETGEEVYFQVQPHRVVGYSLLIFILPLIMMVIGYFVGFMWLPRPQAMEEGIAIATALIGLIIGFLMVKGYDKMLVGRRRCNAQVIGRASEMIFQGTLCNEG